MVDVSYCIEPIAMFPPHELINTPKNVGRIEEEFKPKGLEIRAHAEELVVSNL